MEFQGVLCGGLMGFIGDLRGFKGTSHGIYIR
jgi:hypothetical protein